MPTLAIGQTSKTYRLGWLSTSDEATTKVALDAFLPAMRELGYAVGRNLVLDVRYTRGDASRLPALSDELIALKPDVLLGIESACRVMVRKTSTIPIVVLASPDPVAAGLVKSLARPGTNVTGVSNQTSQLVSKQIELLTEILPKQSRIALLQDATFAGRDVYVSFARETAQAKGLTLQVVEATPNPEGIRTAFAEIAKHRSESVVIGPTGPFNFQRQAIAGEAARLRLPAIFLSVNFVEAGGLLSYGPDFQESFRSEVAPITARILGGGNPAEIPVQQTAKFMLAVNLKTARDFGLKVPQSILLRADRVIE